MGDDNYINYEDEVSQYDTDEYLVSNSNESANEYWHGDNYAPYTDDNGYDYDDDNYDE